MLSREVMGGLCLAILWVNTLLIAAAAGQRLVALVRLGRGLGEVVRGRVTGCEGGALAGMRVEQVGRAAGDGGTIVFHDRSAAGYVNHGTIEVERGEAWEVPAAYDAEVWLDADLLARAGACPSTEAYEEAIDPARKARGFCRTLVAKVAEGSTVWVATAGGKTLVATMDPRALLGRKVALAGMFVVAELLLASACTAAALWPPAFGTVSTIGGVLCLGFFLAVQPAGTALRDAVLVPSRAMVRGQWTRPEAAGPTARARA